MLENQLSVLHIEDDIGDAIQVRRTCMKEFGESAFITQVETVEEALDKIDKYRFDIVLLDLNLGNSIGLDNLKMIKEKNDDLPIIVLTGFDDTETAVQAVHDGAQEYLLKNHIDSRMLGMIIRSSIKRKAKEKQLLLLANQDELTGLPNRRAFTEHMEHWITRAERWNRKECIMYMDVNGFKKVNDELGHDIGDLLLKQVARLLCLQLRASDMVARHAGDEFVIHLDTKAHEPTRICESVANKILALFDEPLDIDGHQVKTGVSIGIAFFPQHGKTLHSLLRSADKAMYKAKRSGKGFAFPDDMV